MDAPKGITDTFSQRGAVMAMEAERHPAGGLRLELSDDEALVVANALNEVAHGIAIPEFATRLGASRDAVVAMLRTINHALSRG